MLRQSEWSTLTYLNLSECFVEMVDNKSFWSSSKLPNLETLCLFCHSEIYRSTITVLFQKSWPKLRKLFIDNLPEKGDKEFLNVLRERKLPNLTEFGLSLSPQRNSVINLKFISQFFSKLESLTFRKYSGLHGQKSFTKQLRELDITDNPNVTTELPSLLSGQFPSLNTLALSNCGLNASSLSFLAQCCVEGRHLNVSYNPECGGRIGHLFDGGCMWNGLLSLDIQQPYINEKAHVDSEVVM